MATGLQFAALAVAIVLILGAMALAGPPHAVVLTRNLAFGDRAVIATLLLIAGMLALIFALMPPETIPHLKALLHPQGFFCALFLWDYSTPGYRKNRLHAGGFFGHVSD